MCTLDLGGGYILPRPPLYYSIETVYILAQEFNNHKSARERENKALLWLIVYTMYIHAYMYTLDMYIAYRVLCAVGLFGWRRLCCPCRCSPSLVSHTRSGFKKKKKFLFFFFFLLLVFGLLAGTSSGRQGNDAVDSKKPQSFLGPFFFAFDILYSPHFGVTTERKKETIALAAPLSFK